MISGKSLDRADWGILRALQENARISYTELGRRVALTPPAVADRVRRLEDAGIIKGYSASIAADRLGLPITAYVRTTTFSEIAYRQSLEALKEMPEVLELHHLTGDECNITKVAAASIEHLEEILDRFARYGRTTTSIVLSTRVDHRVIGPENFPDEGDAVGDGAARRAA